MKNLIIKQNTIKQEVSAFYREAFDAAMRNGNLKDGAKVIDELRYRIGFTKLATELEAIFLSYKEEGRANN